MQKVYEINLDDLMDECPTSEYDTGGYRRSITIELDDKTKLITEMTNWFKKRVKQQLKLSYICDGCNDTHAHKDSIYKCPKCDCEICENCETTLNVCESCYDKIVESKRRMMNNEQTINIYKV